MRRLPLMLLIAACTAALDPADRVHDLRMLAIRVDPPEESLLQPSPVTATALIADPGGGGRAVHYRWVTCAQLDGDTSRCLESSPAFTALGEGDVNAMAEGAEPSVTFNPDSSLLTQLAQLDTYKGFLGLRQPVQLELSAGTEAVVGIKRMEFFLPPLDGGAFSVNVNPVVGPLEFNDAGWEPDASVTFLAQPKAMGFRPPGAAVRNTVAVIEDKTLRQDYLVTTFTGERRSVHETWRYNFFATLGGFSPAVAGGADPLGRDAGIETQWTPVDGQDGGTLTVWVVVRDGRGGETWVTRHAVAP
jgi:hypothetical protein